MYRKFLTVPCLCASVPLLPRFLLLFVLALFVVFGFLELLGLLEVLHMLEFLCIFLRQAVINQTLPKTWLLLRGKVMFSSTVL